MMMILMVKLSVWCGMKAPLIGAARAMNVSQEEVKAEMKRMEDHFLCSSNGCHLPKILSSKSDLKREIYH